MRFFFAPIDRTNYQSLHAFKYVMEGFQVPSHVGSRAISRSFWDSSPNGIFTLKGLSVNWADTNHVPNIDITVGAMEKP